MPTSLKIKEKASVKILAGLFYLSLIVWIALISIQRGLSAYSASAAKFPVSGSKASENGIFSFTSPEVYKNRGLLFLQKGDYREALSNYKSAIDLRPNDYLLWTRLGYVYYKLDEFDNALKAYDKAIRLAPNYAQPKQYRGYLFLKSGDSEQAFRDLGNAAAIDKSLLPEVMQIARRIFADEPAAIENAVRPNSKSAKKNLAFYFLKHKIMSDGIKQFLTGDELDKKEKDEFIEVLIRDKNYSLAFALWASENKIANSAVNSNNLINNSGFEVRVEPRETGFGWKVNQATANVAVSIDNTDIHSGSKSLSLEFSGTSDSSEVILSQLIPVKPGQSYRLTFTGRVQNLVTGGLPVMIVVDGDSKKIFGQSSPITSPDKWQKYTIDFRTTNQTQVVIISLQRLNCTSNPCPVFGSLWLDDFELKRS